MFDRTLLHPYWSPPDIFTLRAGDGRHEVVTLEDLAALVARCEETGDHDEARRLAGEIDQLGAIAAAAHAAATCAAEADVERGSDALERAS
jgi:hypothetical protein